MDIKETPVYKEFSYPLLGNETMTVANAVMLILRHHNLPKIEACSILDFAIRAYNHKED